MLSSHYHHHKSKAFSQLTQCPFTGTLLLFDPGATTSKLAAEKLGPGLDQVTGEAVEEMETATQPLGAPGAGIATQPVQAPGSFTEVQPTGEGDMSAASDSDLIGDPPGPVCRQGGLQR